MRKRSKRLVLKVAVNVCRLLLAVTFLFSGWVKANDPFGTVYKMEDYLAAWNLNVLPDTFLLGCAVILAVFEFTLGVNMLFTISRRLTAQLTLVFITLMTMLTVYIAIANPVSDCGCFGDAVILSNNATLAKNVVLLAAAVIVARWNKLTMNRIAEGVKGLFSLLSFVGVVAYTVYCIIYLPVVDFRPYKVGTDMRAVADGASSRQMFDVKIVYEKDGKTIELSVDDDDPDSTWTYVETRRTELNADAIASADFYVTDTDEEDVTDDILYADGYTLLLIIPDLTKADEGCIDKVNEAYDNAQENGCGFYCLTASTDEKSQTYWRDHTGAEYDFYLAENRMLKTVVRGNPGLVLLKDGMIVRKWSNFDFPDDWESVTMN